MNISLLKKKLLKEILKEHEKEYHCHIQFVIKIGKELSKRYNVDPTTIELACILHDIGRDHELQEEKHEDAGARITLELLKNSGLPKRQINKIISCVKNHSNFDLNLPLEEKVVLTADSASKVLYHEAFMLMCEKETYKEKLEWGLKYLEKGYQKIAFPDFKREITKRYQTLKDIYDSV